MTTSILDTFSMEEIYAYLINLSGNYITNLTLSTGQNEFLRCIVNQGYFAGSGYHIDPKQLRECLDNDISLLTYVTAYIDDVRCLTYMLVIDPMFFKEEIKHLTDRGVIVRMEIVGHLYPTIFTSDILFANMQDWSRLNFYYVGPGRIHVIQEKDANIDI